jgi:hypothetical protein
MKLENEIAETDKILDVRQVEVDKKLNFIGTIVPQRGHTLFEVNLKTSKIDLAVFEIIDISFDDASKEKFLKKRKLIQKPDCLYISALNVKNVYKVLLRDYNISRVPNN